MYHVLYTTHSSHYLIGLAHAFKCPHWNSFGSDKYSRPFSMNSRAKFTACFHSRSSVFQDCQDQMNMMSPATGNRLSKKLSVTTNLRHSDDQWSFCSLTPMACFIVLIKATINPNPNPPSVMIIQSDLKTARVSPRGGEGGGELFEHGLSRWSMK